METEVKTNSKKDIGAVWVRESKKGEKYISMQVTINGEKISLVAFKNSFKEEDSNQPDYRIFPSEQLTK